MKNKVINFVSYLNPLVYSGGGEAITKQVILDLEKAGHKVKITSIRPLRVNFSLKPDLSIYCDIDNRSAYPRGLGIFKIPLAFLKFVSRKKKFVHFLNAYVDLCDKNYLPCNGNRIGQQCPVDGKKCYALREKAKYLCGEASLNVYLSPLHAQVSKQISNKIGPKTFILGPLIDKERFYPDNTKKDIKNLFVGVISEAKGGEILREFSSNNELTLLGKIEGNFNLDFGTHLPFVPYENVPDIMRRSENFIYLPRWPEPQGRVVHEAALCGCNMILNENVGANSFDFDLADACSYRNFSSELVKILENL